MYVAYDWEVLDASDDSPPDLQDVFVKLHTDKQDVSSSIIKQLMRFWSESICKMDKDEKIGSR